MSSMPEFSRKPRRMTDPPQNQCTVFIGEDGTAVKMEILPERIAYFAREATWGDIMREPTGEELADTLSEVAAGKTLSAALKGGMGFRIRSSRVTMDQALRLAEGSGGAGSGAGAQTTRDNDMRDYNIIIPQTIEALLGPDDVEISSTELWERTRRYIHEGHALYADMIDAGIPPQDARYIALPQGFQTQWLHVMSLGNFVKMCEHRLCNGLVQWEINYLTRVMRDQVIMEYPWMDGACRSACEKSGACTAKTMLFPPCGAFGGHQGGWRMPPSRQRPKPGHAETLYPASQNSAMEYANWDYERTWLEKQNPDIIYTMAGQPVSLRKRG
jgi:hypothetical protein